MRPHREGPTASRFPHVARIIDLISQSHGILGKIHLLMSGIPNDKTDVVGIRKGHSALDMRWTGDVDGVLDVIPGRTSQVCQKGIATSV